MPCTDLLFFTAEFRLAVALARILSAFKEQAHLATAWNRTELFVNCFLFWT